MDYRSYRPSKTNSAQDQPVSQPNRMSLLAMTTPSLYMGFRNEYAWDPIRSSEHIRPSSSSKPVALPSIRQAFPELQLSTLPSDGASRPPSSATSPSSSMHGILTSPDYALTPTTGKRRRSFLEDHQEFSRPRQIPRIHKSPSEIDQRQLSPQTSAPLSAGWSSTPRADAYSPRTTSPMPVKARGRQEYQPSLPSLSGSNFERSRSIIHPREETLGEEQQSQGQAEAHPVDKNPPPSSRDTGYGYPYQQHPSRYQSLSMSSIRSYDRTPFAVGGYGSSPQQELARYSEIGGSSGDTKQRKRRGNLPKETTDKLRSWFVAHLQHPYPTEDEKQELMRQTGLQMNQISNWFINARRRQLPAMINNARAEADAMSGRGGDGKLLGPGEQSHYTEEKRASLPLSDGDEYDEDDHVGGQSSRPPKDSDRRDRSQIKRGSV